MGGTSSTLQVGQLNFRMTNVINSALGTCLRTGPTSGLLGNYSNYVGGYESGRIEIH